ncbi:hypothetical protein MSAN_00135500 [Mycena sanguinolenta]|uniref:Uncharacterized protein n=1 Tax=Mycena sanguinolenta TaxID=230812 RepID=A0A8H6ZDR3_9AGAR|nr:hypothetical protein MSAN_00135500 [Mycena sanguinolenta]
MRPVSGCATPSSTTSASARWRWAVPHGTSSRCDGATYTPALAFDVFRRPSSLLRMSPPPDTPPECFPSFLLIPMEAQCGLGNMRYPPSASSRPSRPTVPHPCGAYTDSYYPYRSQRV